MKKEGVSAWKVAAAYIGTVVGAGFATGQEVLQFFSRFGARGLAGVAVATLLFIVFGMIIMELGRELQARSHLSVIRYAGGRWLGAIIDGIITFFLFGALTVMLAGTGALTAQQFGLPALFGVVVMGVATAVTVLSGLGGVIDAICFVVPFLLISVVGVSAWSVARFPPDLSAAAPTAGVGLMGNWLTAAVLYVSYNTILSVAVLGPLGAQARGRKTVRLGALLGGLGLGLGLLMLYLAAAGHQRGAPAPEIPMVYIAGRWSPTAAALYALVLLAEVYTTAVGALYGLTARLADTEKPGGKARAVAIGATILAALASQLGFSTLVKYLYPLVGYGGVVLWVCLAAKKRTTSGH